MGRITDFARQPIVTRSATTASLLALLSACARPGGLAQSSEGSDNATSQISDSADPTTSSTASASMTDETTGSSSGATSTGMSPECPTPLSSDLSVAVTVDPPTPVGSSPRHEGTCTIVDVATSEGDVFTFVLDCSGDGGPAPTWQATVTLGGDVGSELPESIEVDASVVLIVVLENEEWQGSAFAVRVGGDLVLAGLSGAWLDIDFAGGEPQALWSPMIVTAEARGLCPGQTAECNTSVERGGLVFGGVLPSDVSVFDHDTHLEGNYEFRVGAALTGTGEPQCDGVTSDWYDFVVINHA